jgi:hypothetical protein
MGDFVDDYRRDEHHKEQDGRLGYLVQPKEHHEHYDRSRKDERYVPVMIVPGWLLWQVSSVESH